MQNETVEEILKKLHNSRGKPRLEIVAAGETSIEANYFNEFEGGNKVIYIFDDYYADAAYEYDFRINYVVIDKSDLVRLVEMALSSEYKAAELNCTGRHYRHFQSGSDYSGREEGGPPKQTLEGIRLSLDIKNEPSFILSYGDMKNGQ